MSYLQTMTQMLASNDSIEHERHIYEIHQMVYEMIQELVPAIVKEEMASNIHNVMVKIQMDFDGKKVDFKDIRDYINSEIEKALKN